jgi:hypothetical protein
MSKNSISGSVCIRILFNGVSLLLHRKDNNKFQVNFSAFHSTYEVETPTCSARDLETHYQQQQQQKEPSNPYHKKVSKFSIAVQSFFVYNRYITVCRSGVSY